MPQLSRSGRLLRQVGGQVHASSDDHEQDAPRPTVKDDSKRRIPRKCEAESSIPTPPGTNSSFESARDPEVVDLEDEKEVEVVNLENEDEDFINAEPMASDEEVPKAVSKAGSGGRGSGGFVMAPGVEDVGGCGREKEEKKGFKIPGGGDNSEGKKRKSPGSTAAEFQHLDVETASSLDPHWIGGTPKKQKREGVVQNIFVAPKRVTTYSKKGMGRDKEKEKRQKEKEFRNTKLSPKKEAPKAVFKVLDTGIEPDAGSGDLSFATAGAAGLRPGSSSSLSSARSTPEPDEVQVLDLPDPKPFKPLVECSFCGQEVDKFILEEFEDRHKTGGDLSFKWRRRFCKHHKQQEAKDTWRDRSYPDIDWYKLERRMRKHDSFLIDVLNDKTHSHYREKLKEKVKPRAKSAQQTFKALMDDASKGGDSKPGASVGYYGPKGERMMTDHIITNLADDMRKQAKRDKLVASSGVQGGVSGFVQAVLVPHLAELLIKEDMGLTGDWFPKAREIIAESCEVGEILNPEAAEKVVEIADDSDDRYD